MIIKIYKNFKSGDKRFFETLIFLNTILFFFEFSSLSSVPLFVASIINPEFTKEKMIIVFNYLNIKSNFSNTDLQIFVGALTITLFFIKNIFFVFTTFINAKFFKNYKVNLCKNIFNYFLEIPYEDFVKENPSKLTRIVSEDVQGSFQYLNSFFTLIREISALLAIFLLLLYVNFLMNILISIFLLLIVFTYLKIIKPILKKSSKSHQEIRKKNIQLINETFGSLKDIKVSLQESYLFEIFRSQIDGLENNLKKIFIIEKMPKVILEIISLSVIIIIFLFYFSSEKSTEMILPTLSLWVVSFVRFIPAFNGLTTALGQMRINKVCVEAVYSYFKKQIKISDKKSINLDKKLFLDKSINSEIDLQNITFRYKNTKINPLKNINLKIQIGKTVAITGETGSGKTTLFLILLGLLKPNEGEIMFGNKSIFRHLNEWRSLLGYVSQNAYLYDASIRDNIIFDYKQHSVDEAKLNDSIKISELSETIKKNKNGLDTIVGNDGLSLSGGEKQRIALARALYKDPKILLMDEFTSSLDENTELKIIENLRTISKNKTIIFITHRKNTLNICDEVYELKNGQLNIVK